VLDNPMAIARFVERAVLAFAHVLDFPADELRPGWSGLSAAFRSCCTARVDRSGIVSSVSVSSFVAGLGFFSPREISMRRRRETSGGACTVIPALHCWLARALRDCTFGQRHGAIRP
jgi:hypothetical protein